MYQIIYQMSRENSYFMFAEEKERDFYRLLGRNDLHFVLTSEESNVVLEDNPELLHQADVGNVFPIHMAAACGSVNRVSSLVNAGAKIDCLTLQGKSPLHYAALTDNTPVIEYLLSEGANIDRMDWNLNCTPVLYASMFNRLRSVLIFLKSQCQVNVTDKLGRTILHYAAWNYQAKLCAILIQDFDISIDAKDNNGCTPLHYAAGVGSFEIVHFLSHSGANMLAMNADGHIPLHLAAAGGHKEVVEQFIKAGVDINYSSAKNKSPPLFYAAMSSNYDLLCYFVDNGSDIGVIGNKGQTVLHAAAMGGYLDNIRALVEIGANTIIENEEGETPLHITAKYGYEDCVEFLQRKAPHTVKYRDVNGLTPMNLSAFGKHLGSFELLLNEEASSSLKWRDNKKMTKLHWAACADHATMARELLTNRVEVNAVDQEGRTPLHWATSGNCAESVRVLMEHSAVISQTCMEGNTAVHYAAMLETDELMQVFLTLKSIDVESLLNLPNVEGMTPLFIAATHGASDVVNLLAKSSFLLDFSITANPTKNTVLHKAVQSDCSLECIKLLVEKGCSLLATNTAGELPLHFACKSDQRVDILVWMLSNSDGGTMVHATTRKGMNGLHIASYFGCTTAANVLLTHGSSHLLKDIDDKIPLDYATEECHQGCVQLLSNLES